MTACPGMRPQNNGTAPLQDHAACSQHCAVQVMLSCRGGVAQNTVLHVACVLNRQKDLLAAAYGFLLQPGPAVSWPPPSRFHGPSTQ